MKKTLFGLLCLMLSAGLAAAQEITKERKGQGYSFVAGGGVVDHGEVTPLMHVGVGGEGVVYRSFGLGAEIGYLFSPQYSDSGLGIGSINGFYQFKRAGSSSKIVPFVTGGYTLAFRGGTANGFNFGGGVTYWMHRRLGLRMEFRDHVPSDAPGVHLWQGRLGISF